MVVDGGAEKAKHGSRYIFDLVCRNDIFDMQRHRRPACPRQNCDINTLEKDDLDLGVVDAAPFAFDRALPDSVATIGVVSVHVQ